MLPVNPAEEVVADDVNQPGLQTVFGLHYHINAVRSQGGKPASEGLQVRIQSPSITKLSSGCPFTLLLGHQGSECLMCITGTLNGDQVTESKCY